jgi:uncharacterized protein YjbJ (UPF0337 family)
MRKDTLANRWDYMRSDSKRRWSKLTDDDLDRIRGNVEDLISLVQKKYNYTRDKAEHDVTRFMKSHNGRAYQIARRLPNDMDLEVRRHPWAAVATAVGLGIAVGFLVKPGHSAIAKSHSEWQDTSPTL